MRRTSRTPNPLRDPLASRALPMTGLAMLVVLACSTPTQTEPLMTAGAFGAVTFGTAVDNGNHRAVPVTFESQGVTLAGVIYLPAAPGNYPAGIHVHGSGRVPRSRFTNFWMRELVARGLAVLTYDKRGVAESGGACCPQHMPTLGEDAMAAVAAARLHPEINPDRVGLYGGSQAGWIIPYAAARDPRAKFTLIISGPTVSVGHENLYSALTEELNCGQGGLSIEEAEEQTAAAPPSGFDPLPDLQSMTQPGMWIYGMKDISVPPNLSIAILDELIAGGKPYTVVKVPGANHGLGSNNCGGGPTVPGWQAPMFAWLAANS